MLAGMKDPPEVIVAANDDMALGAMEAVKARNLKGITIIGFDALPEALAKVRDGGLDRDDRAVPRPSRAPGACRRLVDFLKTARSRRPRSPDHAAVAITKDNLKKAERLGEVK